MRKKFEEGSPSRLLMKIGFYTGCIAYRGLRFLADDPRSIQMSAKNLVKDGYLTDEIVLCGDGERSRVLIPTHKAHLELKGTLFPYDGDYLRHSKHRLGYKLTTLPDREKMRASAIARVVTTSEQVCFFWGVWKRLYEVYPKKQTALFPGEKALMGPVPLGHAYYYRAWDLKRLMHPRKARACSGRAQGYLADGADLYSILSMPRTVMLVRDRQERDTLQMMSRMLLPGNAPGWAGYLILTRNISLLSHLAVANETVESMEHQHRFFLDPDLPGMSHCLILPQNADGMEVLAMLLLPRGRDHLVYLPSVHPMRGSYDMVYDYMENGEYVLSMLVPDVFRLKKFLRALRIFPDRTGHLHIYAFQKEPIRRLVEGMPNVRVTVYTVANVKDAMLRVTKEERER